MTEAKFNFISAATGGDKFTVVSFSCNEAISTLYRYELEIKSPLSAAASLDDLLDSPARFVTEINGQEYPVYGVLSSIDELRTVQGYVYYQVILVPRLWRLSIYKTNEIYTEEKTVDVIIRTVLENAGFSDDADFDLIGLDDRDLLKRDYRCQFGESDFDFISRLMENEGIFYYFDHSGDAEKIIFINDMNYLSIPHPGLIFDVAAQTSRQHNSINAWSCRKQRLAAGVTIRDYNPDQPSQDISDTMPIDQMGQGTEYLYGDNICDAAEASYLSTIRAEECLTGKTRYYGESSVTRLQSGYLFGLNGHSNETYNGVEYLAIEVNHEGQHLDMSVSAGSTTSQSTPQYRNSFVAIEASEQFRPARVTPKPRFYGNMTAFVYAEAASGVAAEVDEQGRYRVHLPFDRADGTKDSSDPHRKASTWIRMAQPYAGQNEGMCFPLKGGTEVLLTFINGDPDRPVISAALANAAEPSLINDQNAHVSNIHTTGGLSISARSGTCNYKFSPITSRGNQASASFKNRWRVQNALLEQEEYDEAVDDLFNVNLYGPDETDSYDGDNLFYKLPRPSLYDDPYHIPDDTLPNYPFTQLNDFGQADTTDLDAAKMTSKEEDEDGAHIDRTTGPTYVHKSGSTFPYPEQERVYFCGTFHEDFHMDDLGISGYMRHLKSDFTIDYDATPIQKDASNCGSRGPGEEIFHFPEPGGDGDQSVHSNFPTERKRGVSEDKRWGDQMNYAWGRSFNWAGGPALGGGENGSFAEYNYGNGYTENLLTETGGTSADLLAHRKIHADDYTGYGEFQGEGLESAAMEKTWGSVYSYHNGFSLDIKEGNSYERVYGDKNEEVHGHSVSEIRGSTHTNHHGAVSEMFLGAKNEFAWNYENAIHGGAATDFYGGIKVDFFLGSAMELFLALKQEIGLSLNFELFFAPKFGVGKGPEIKSVKPLKLEAEDAAIKDLKVKLGNIGTEIKKAGITLKCGRLFLAGNDLTLL